MYVRRVLATTLALALLCLLPGAAGAQNDTTPPSPLGSVSQAALAQTGIIPPFQYFNSRLSNVAFTPVAQSRSYTRSDLQQATDGRFFVLVDFSPTGQQTLGLLVSSLDPGLLLAYLNGLQVYFQAVAVPPGMIPGLGMDSSFRDDVYSIRRTTGDIEVEMALLPRGNVTPSQDYVVYFAIDPTFTQPGQAHLYQSPRIPAADRWSSAHAWVVADSGSVALEMWRNDPGAYIGSQEHQTGGGTPRPLTDDVAPGTAGYNALVSGPQFSVYRLYGAFVDTNIREITPPPSVNTNPACPLPPRMVVGQTGIVDDSVPLPNRLRSSPSLSGAQIGLMRPNEIFTVIGGPVCANGILWWQVNYNGREGWTAEGQGGAYYIRPY